MFWQRFRHEVKVSGQHLIFLYLAIKIAFMYWMMPSVPEGGEVPDLNIAEAWNSLWGYNSELLLAFTVLCAVRLVVVLALARWRGEI